MIRFHTLGALGLHDADGRELHSILAQPKRTALLAYLAASFPGQFHRRDTLLALFWPESDAQHARDSLRQAVRYLRRSLGEGVLVGRGDEELGVDEGLLWCDAAAFEEAVGAGEFDRALEIYRGELLVGLFLSEVPEFERWLERERGRLRVRAVEAAWAMAERCEATRDRTGVTRYARRALELCPDDEGTLRRLIGLLDRLGDRASAVRAYEDFAARLAEECGIEPSVETRALVEGIRAGGGETELSLPVDAKTRRSSAGSPPDVPNSAPSAAEPGGGSGKAPHHDTHAQTRWGRLARLAPAGGFLLLAIAGAAAVAWDAGWRRGDAQRVVVVPFDNRTGDSSLDPLGRWAADWVSQGLTRTKRIQVVDAAVGLPGTREVAYGAHLRTLLEGTRAGMIVSGAYYRHGDSIQFQVQITDPDGVAAVPAVEPISGSLRQPQIAVQVLSERVTGVLAAHWDPWIRALGSDGSRPPSYKAYQAWIEGLEHFSRKEYGAAQERLRYAASMDSSFISPLIWAAAAHGNVGEYQEADSLARTANRRRDQILPFDRYFLDLWRAILSGDRVAEYRAARGMLQVAPASELALYLVGNSALKINHVEEAAEVLRRINVERSIVDWDAYGTRLPEAYHLLGRHDIELDGARRVRERRPELLRAALDEVRALAALGRAEEALQLLDGILPLSPQPQITPAEVALVAAEELQVHGHSRAAEQALARAIGWYEARPPEERANETHRYGLARVLYRAGRWSEARGLFQELSAQSPENVSYVGYLGVVAARGGQAREAEHISGTLSRVATPYLRGRNTLWRARIAAVRGQEGEAIALVRAALAQGQPHRLVLHAQPDFESLWGNPVFRRLLQPVR